ncbi:MAG: helix-turn-helix domain-containing protein [Coriobacteriales bacterium]|nr:helix-turn-helix domain-containing protein [Coriobacteriales bacterium]
MLKDNLLMLRNIHGFSQEEVAQRIGISRQAYAKWESGATIPDVEKCSRLAQLYETTVDELLKTETYDDGRILPPAPKGKNLWGTVTMNERGQIVIPKVARDHFGLVAGHRLLLMSDDNEGFALVPVEFFEKKLALLSEGYFPAQPR